MTGLRCSSVRNSSLISEQIKRAEPRTELLGVLDHAVRAVLGVRLGGVGRDGDRRQARARVLVHQRHHRLYAADAVLCSFRALSGIACGPLYAAAHSPMPMWALAVPRQPSSALHLRTVLGSTVQYAIRAASAWVA